MSHQALFLIAFHLPLLWWLMAVDRFESWDRKADWVEAHLFPQWLRWSIQGDKATWLQHSLVALVVSLYSGLLSLLAPESLAFGAAVGGWITFVAYTYREGLTIRERWGTPNMWTHPSPNRVGWAVDGIGDVVGPLLVALGWTAAL